MQQSHVVCRSALSICLVAVLAIAVPTAVFSQVLSGVISGTVNDATQAVVPNATVTIVNADTGVIAWHGETNESGLYRAPSLPAGPAALLPSFELPFMVQGPWDDPIMLPDPEILMQRSGAAAPLLDAARNRAPHCLQVSSMSSESGQ